MKKIGYLALVVLISSGLWCSYQSRCESVRALEEAREVAALEKVYEDKESIENLRVLKFDEIRAAEELEAKEKADAELLEKQRIEENKVSAELDKKKNVVSGGELPTAPVPQGIQITSRSANDYYPDSGEVIGIISIPSIGLYQPVNYGDSQSNIDNYQVVIRQGMQFNANASVLLAGHNYKSFGALYNINVGDIVEVHSYYGDFRFAIDSKVIGNTDSSGLNVYDSNGTALIDFYSRVNKLVMYTCGYSGNSERLVVTASRL